MRRRPRGDLAYPRLLSKADLNDEGDSLEDHLHQTALVGWGDYDRREMPATFV